MVFSEALRLKIQEQAHFRCCLCHSLWVEIHHIIPQSEGGPDTEENAAPLCPSCHETYGANPQKRKFIRNKRDWWFETCKKQIAPSDEKLQRISEQLCDIVRVVRNIPYIPGAAGGVPKEYADFARYSFERDEFVHPLVVRELLGWLSDPAPTVVAIDLLSSNRSNRFYGKFDKSSRSGRTWIRWTGSEGQYFAYAHIATSPSGVQMVECYDCGGGSGVFGSVGLFSFECDQSLSTGGNEGGPSRMRAILKVMGSVPLGDRYAGKITYDNGVLDIGPDEGRFKTSESAGIELKVQ